MRSIHYANRLYMHGTDATNDHLRHCLEVLGDICPDTEEHGSGLEDELGLFCAQDGNR